MRAFKTIGFFILVFSIFSCKTEEIILHGNLTGTVTDSESNLPLNGASVILSITKDTAITADDGSFLLKNLRPGEYEIQASKATYASNKQIADVESGVTTQIDFSLIGIPAPNPSVKFLDFGLDSTTLRFSISNIGKGKFTYFLTPSKDWISVSPSNGAIENKPEIIVVTIMKNGLSRDIYKETLKVFTFNGQTPLPEITIPLFLNGVADRDGNYYKVVWIGTQLWMGENLNVGTQINTIQNSANNGIIEKYCYDNRPENCKIYGSLYQWDEMMQYNPPDNGFTGTLQGVCPDGWHLPTSNEWTILQIYLEGGSGIGGKLKEAGFEHWLTPNTGATNESGWSALPGGYTGTDQNVSLPLGMQGNWWMSSIFDPNTLPLNIILYYNSEQLFAGLNLKTSGFSVRCLKDPEHPK